DVRGRGLMCGIEVVKDRATRATFPADERPRARQIISRHFDEAGIIVSVTPSIGDIVPFLPPLCVTRSEIDRILTETDRALAKVEAEFGIS
ncbi:MAG: aminotransferase class III-fold pyridoxal phosphate-dependent enzyme, partial [Gemmataceae bacterium]|nr:aminotransferase class III-fold pyridoxal phosphate-dependent enzyme [Gemmataceae bacterium]